MILLSFLHFMPISGIMGIDGCWKKLKHNAFLCFYLAVGLFRLLGLTRKGLRPGTSEFNLRRKKIKAMLPHLSSGPLVEITWRKEIQSCEKRNLCCVFFFLRTVSETNNVHEHVKDTMFRIAQWFHSAFSFKASRVRIALPDVFFLCISSNFPILITLLHYIDSHSLYKLSLLKDEIDFSTCKKLHLIFPSYSFSSMAR